MTRAELIAAMNAAGVKDDDQVEILDSEGDTLEIHKVERWGSTESAVISVWF